MFNFRKSIKVPNSINMGGPQNYLTYDDEEEEFKFIIYDREVALITATGISGDILIASDTLFIDEDTKRIGIDVENPTVDLDVLGDVSIRNDLTVSGDFNAELDITYINSAVENLSVTSTMLVGDRLSVSGPSVFAGDLTVSGQVYGNTSITFEGVIESLQITSDLTVNRTSTLPIINGNLLKLAPLIITDSETGIGAITTRGYTGSIEIESFGPLGANSTVEMVMVNNNIGPDSMVLFQTEFPNAPNNANIFGLYIDVIRYEDQGVWTVWHNLSGNNRSAQNFRLRWQIFNPK